MALGSDGPPGGSVCERVWLGEGKDKGILHSDFLGKFPELNLKCCRSSEHEL